MISQAAKVALNIAVILLSLCSFSSSAQDTSFIDDQVDFFKESIFPILENNCFECHGGGDKLKGELYLTSRGSMITGGESGAVLDVDTLTDSLILEMLSYEDEFTEMPPDGKLPQEDIDALTKWILMGAPWDAELEREPGEKKPEMIIDDKAKDFWSFKPVRNVSAPNVDDPAWATNPIDALVYARLQTNGLSPSPDADKRTLIRRAYYNITGLPPTASEVRAFINDDSPNAYEKIIDTLLASPHYGEKWARHWLDLVRYADSHGYERDSDKPYMWRYRDYVVDAFNQDLPYDQFIKEQIAGDEFDDPTPAQITATGYYRLGVWDDEPADPTQAVFDNLDDIVTTTSQVFLGMTIGCARCHDHKLDPIPQKDYYSFLAFFRNTTEIKRVKDNGYLRNIMNKKDRAEYEIKMAMKQHQEAYFVEKLYASVELFKANAAVDNPTWLRAKDSRLSDITDLSYRFYRDTWESMPDFDMIKAETEGVLEHNYITVAPASRTGAIGFVFEGKLLVPEKGAYTFSVGATDGLRITIGKKVIFETTGLGKVNTSADAKLKKGLQDIKVEYFTKKGPPYLNLSWKGVNLKKRSLSLKGLRQSDEKNIFKLIKEHGEQYLSKDGYAAFEETNLKLEDVRKKNFERNAKWVAAIAEKGIDAPDTHLLIRGSAHAPGEIVLPAFPQVLSPPEAILPEPSKEKNTTYRRTVLADWLASPDNPMTARVMANRIWQHHFGRGIVRSTNDFGSLGDRPTHPELLDWLSGEFIKGGWSMKSLHKKIMMSKTYRMASKGNAKALAQDPTNDLLWRYDMRRLTAEEFRDSILLATGELNLELGGPTVYPELSPEVIETSSKKGQLISSGMWGESPIEQQNRRSIYIHLKRSLKYPMLSDFDFADIDASCPVRFITTQPAQALNLLNSPFIHARAKKLLDRVQREVGEKSANQIQRVFDITIGRRPTKEETEMSNDFLDQLETQEALSPEKAMERYCLLVLNLNEFMYID